MPFAPIADMNMYYEEAGLVGGEPVLLLNGAFGVVSLKSDWGAQYSALADRYRIILFEHRGHGHTNNPSNKYEGGYNRLAEDALALLEYLELPKVHLLGFSDGAITALKLTALHPERVGFLVAIGANYYNEPQQIESLVRLQADTIERDYPKWAAQLEQDHAAQGPGYWRTLADAMYPLWLDESSYPSKDELASIKVPTLLMTGQKDYFGTVKQNLEMNQLVAGSELCIVPGAAHAVLQQRPAITSAIILDFLERQIRKRDKLA